MHKICFDCFHPLKSFFCLSIDVSFVLMGLFYVYEVIVVNGLGIEVCGVLGFVIFVFSDPKAGNDTARPAVPVLLTQAFRTIRVVGCVPRPLVAYIEAMRKFFCKEYCFEPIEVVGGYLTASHDVFENDAVATPCIFEPCHNGRNIGFVLDQSVAGYEYASFAEAYTQVECACSTSYLLFNGRPLAAGEGL